MTIGEVFTHNIGDKYHYKLAPSAVPPSVDRMTIIDKYFSELGDTVFYERFHDSYWTEVEWEPEPHLVYHFYSLYDTVFYTDLDSLISFYDNRFQCGSFWFECDTIIYYSSEYCSTLINGYFFFTSDFEPDVYHKEYGQGLGWTYYYYYSGSGLPPGVIIDMKLFYYQKNGIDCGSPDTIIVSTHEIKNPGSILSIFPNPAKDNFNIQFHFTNKSLRYNIFTALGELVDSGEWSQPYSSYDCQYLTPGLYIIQIEIDSKLSRYKLLIE